MFVESVNKIDIDENILRTIDSTVLRILLKDQTTKTNIIWATDNYTKYNPSFCFDSTISVSSITGKYEGIIKPRVLKSLEEKQERLHHKGEVFTPSWICNQQNNLLNKDWFLIDSPFNEEDLSNKTWHTKYEKIAFLKEHTWQEYINQTSLEISCGEAPYLASRYDTVNGTYIEVKDRIGLLDRKLRIISENINNKDDWFHYAVQALKSIYGFEWQGDNLILARENILYTIIEHYQFYFKKELLKEQIELLANIISWNIWQMDGLKFVIPNSCLKEKEVENSSVINRINEDCPAEGKKDHYVEHNGIYCKIKDWTVSEKGKTIRFVDLLK